MAIKLGDGTKWGDVGAVIGARPFDYPRPFHVRIEIRTAWGTNYVDDTADVSQRIEDTGQAQVGRYYATIHDGSKLDIEDHDEILITGPDEIRIFGGFVDHFDETSAGPHFAYDVVAVNWAWLLDHPKYDQYNVRVYEDMADSAIIADFMADLCPEIEASTHVNTVEASLDKEYYENMTPRQMLDALSKRTGAFWYVDEGPADAYKCYLHYFTPGAEEAPFELMDNPATVDHDTYFPYHALTKRHEHGTCTRVEVEGRPSLGANDTVWYAGDGTTRVELKYQIRPRTDQITPLIQVAEVEKTVGIGGVHSLGTGEGQKDVLWYPFDKYLEFLVAPPDGLLMIRIRCRELMESYGYAEDAAGEAKYGRQMTVKVKDENIHDSATATLMAAELLDRWKGTIVTYTCTVKEPGCRAGQTIKLTNALRSLSAEEFLIQRVTSRNVGGSYWAFDLELGKHFADTVDVFRDINERKIKKKQKWQEEGWIVSVPDGSDPVITYRIVENGGTDDDKWTHGVDDSDGEKWKLNTGSSLADDSILEVDSDGKVAINVTGDAAGQMHIDQDDPEAAIPVLVLDQAAVTTAFIKVIGESADGDLTRSLVQEGDQASETLVGWEMIEVEDSGGQIGSGKYHSPLYSLSA